MKKKRALLILFLFSSLLLLNLNKNFETANINSDGLASAGVTEIEKLWEVNETVTAICIGGGFLYSVVGSSNSILTETNITETKGEVVISKRNTEDGSLVWNKTVELVNMTIGLSYDSILLKEGFLYTVWWSCNTTSYLDSSLLSKWTTEGELVWSLTLNGISKPSLFKDNEGVYVFAQTGRDSIPTYPYLAKIFSNGTIGWNKTIETGFDSNSNFRSAGAWIKEENIYAFGCDNEANHNSLLKVSTSGQVVWNKEIEEGNYNPIDIWGNNESIYTASSKRDPTGSVIKKWSFDGENIWESSFQENLLIDSIWADNENLYSLGHCGKTFREYRLSLIKWDILEGSLVWEKREEFNLFFFSANCLRGEGNERIYTTSLESIICWKLPQDDGLPTANPQDYTIIFVLGAVGVSVVGIAVLIYSKAKRKNNK